MQTGNLEFLAKQVVEGFITGLHKSPFHGFSVEFAEHRQYNTGQSIRHIDWKLFARTEKLFVKRFEEETNLRCQVIIDRSSSMYFPSDGLNKIRFSVYAAASLIYMLRKQRDATGLSVFGNSIEFNSAARSGSVHIKMLFSKLEELLNMPVVPSSSPIAQTLHQLAEAIHKRSLVIIFSDMFQSGTEDVFAALQHLKYNKHEVILFNVHDKKLEMEFDFANRPYLFTDSETGEKIKLHPNAVRQQFIEQSTAFMNELKLKCAQYKIDFVEAEVGTDFDQVLLPFLIKRHKML